MVHVPHEKSIYEIKITQHFESGIGVVYLSSFFLPKNDGETRTTVSAVFCFGSNQKIVYILINLSFFRFLLIYTRLRWVRNWYIIIYTTENNNLT